MKIKNVTNLLMREKIPILSCILTKLIQDLRMVEELQPDVNQGT